MSEGLVLAGRYQLIRKLGQGGMGSVWRAQDMTLGAEVAVKLIDPAFAGSAEAIMRFKREAQAAAMIRSTHVVQILDHGIDNAMPFIAMELLKGESLAERLESVGKLSAKQAGHILGHVGRALTLAHEHGIVHRDMKPENIFLVPEGDEEVGKVLDFGIARQSGGLSDSGGLKTQTGAILGTPYYMSPEQATGQSVDHLTDIWAFGVIASECLTGRRAFDAESLGGLFHAICIKDMPVPSQLGEVPPGFDEWFTRTAARDKSVRFQSVKEAATELRVICGRVSGLASDEVYSSRLIGAQPSRAQSPTSGDPRAQKDPLAFENTAVPSARSVSVSPPQRTRRSVLVFALVGAAAIAAIYVGWRSANSASTPATSTAIASGSASVAIASVPAVTSQNAPPVVSATLEPKPQAIAIIDAGSATNNALAPVSAAANRLAQPPRRNAPAVAPPAPATPTKDAPPVVPVKKPTAPPARDDNAAGI
jgi:serine/threonine-protein kinase